MTYRSVSDRICWQRFPRCLPLLGLLLVVACTYPLQYNPAYMAAARRPVDVQLDGKALIYTTPQEDNYVYSGHPTSMTGSATTAEVPLGIIVREAARAAFADVFRGGADASNSVASASGYRVIVRPKPLQYSYQYNQIRNLGFVITPIVEMQIDVSVLDAAGATVWERNYVSGEVTAPSYMINLKPEEEINRATHSAAYNLMAKAASDIAREVSPRG